MSRPVADLSGLPRKTRIRLWLTRRVDLAAGWLSGHGMWRAARLLYRACGMW